MRVKTGEKKLSFLFQESDMFCEMGYKLLEQEIQTQQLPYKREQQSGREKMTFLLDAPNLVPLSDLEGRLGNDEIIDILYELFFLIEKVEENGFMKKGCIWCRYEDVYYDTDERRLKIALLPISGAVRYADFASWQECFENTVSKLAQGLALEKAERVVQLARLLAADSDMVEEALLELERFGNGRSGLLVNRAPKETRNSLRLYYSGRNARLEFIVGDRDFVIGKSSEKSDGIVDESVSRAVSRQHCAVTRLGNRFFVQDLDSVNHTLVNGIMIPPYELMELENNDILSVADIDFRVTVLENGGNGG